MKSILYDFTPDELQNLLDTSESYSDLLKKIGLNPKGGNPDTLKKIIKEFELDETQLNINRKKLFSKCAKKAINSKPIEDIFSNKISIQSGKLLKRLFKEEYKEKQCEICGITNWMNKEIAFQLHHIDGNHFNNSLNNLMCLCPNCHSQTSNYCGKSSRKNTVEKQRKVNKIKRSINNPKFPSVSREELKNKIRNNSFVSIAKEYGVTDNAIRKWCDKYRLPRKVSLIHLFSDDEWEKI